MLPVYVRYENVRETAQKSAKALQLLQQSIHFNLT